MPIVRINMFEGRSAETKRNLIEGVTALVADACNVSPATVHVLIDEMPRGDWGRGGVVNADRGDRPKPDIQESVFFSISDVITVPERRAEYLDYRRDSVHPTMATMPGYGGSWVAQDTSDENHFILLIRWRDQEARSFYQRSQEHDDLRAKIRGELTTRMEISSYVRLDFSHGVVMAEHDPAPSFLRVSWVSVPPAKENAYFELRRLEVHPVMATFDGFLSSTVLRSRDEAGGYVIVDQWESEDAANGYAASDIGKALDAQTRGLIAGDPRQIDYQVLDL